MRGDSKIGYFNSFHTISDTTIGRKFADILCGANLCVVVHKLFEVIVGFTQPVPKSLFSDEWYFSLVRHNGRKVVGVRIVHHYQFSDAAPHKGDCSSELN